MVGVAEVVGLDDGATDRQVADGDGRHPVDDGRGPDDRAVAAPLEGDVAGGLGPVALTTDAVIVTGCP